MIHHSNLAMPDNRYTVCFIALYAYVHILARRVHTKEGSRIKNNNMVSNDYTGPSAAMIIGTTRSLLVNTQ